FLTVSYSLATVTQYVPTLVQASEGMRRVEELMEHEPAVLDSGTKRLPRFSKEIAFENVAFGYTKERRDLELLKVRLPCGEYIAVVGSSGSGKSTILSLLMRLYDADKGVITIDGLNISEIPLASLRQQFGFVPQESFLFDLSIRENIRLGRPSATDEEVAAAAHAA